MKRLSDIFISTVVLLLFLPFGLIIAFSISIESRGGVFYIQKRVGRRGQIFKLLKFRSMYTNSQNKGNLTIGMNDSRITKIGLTLRKFKLDEFPQFLNVLIGNMSIVGPRPEVEEFVKLYNEEQRQVLKVKPGITDYASLYYFNENELLSKSANPHKTYVEEIMPNKIKMNLEYIKKQTFLEDMRIILQTFAKIFRN